MINTLIPISGFLNKVKDKAENVGQQLQAKMDENKEPSPQLSRRANNIAGGGGGKVPPGRPPPPKKLESSVRVLLSLFNYSLPPNEINGKIQHNLYYMSLVQFLNKFFNFGPFLVSLSLDGRFKEVIL